jgi:hypothetical protein
MADKLSFALFDGAGAPLTGVVCSFVKYVDRSGAARTPPAIVDIGGGEYGFAPSDDDEAVGTCFLIDCTAAADKRRVSGAIHTPAAPFVCWHLEDAAGALWTGAAPTVGVWRDFAGAPRTPPAVVSVGALGYLFAVTPSTADLSVDVAFRFDSPANAFHEFFTGSLERQPWAAPSPGPVKNPASDIVSFLNGKVADATTLTEAVNLFVGPERSFPRTPALALFFLNTGGPGPMPYLQGRRTALCRPTVQVLVRIGAEELETGEKVARAVFAWLHQYVLTGYLSLYARDSAPVYLGETGDQLHRWAMNFECPYRAQLDA